MAQVSASGTATTPVRAAHRIDRTALERYLGEHVPETAPIRAMSQFAAGQSNPTYLIEGPERRGEAGRDGRQNSRVRPRIAPWFS